MTDVSPNVYFYHGTQSWNESHFWDECGHLTSKRGKPPFTFFCPGKGRVAKRSYDALQDVPWF